MAEKTLNAKEMREVIDKIVDSQMDKIKEELFRKNSPFGGMFCGDNIGIGNSSAGIYVPRPQGSTELLDPDGEVVMRDGEIVEKPLEITYSRRAVYRR